MKAFAVAFSAVAAVAMASVPEPTQNAIPKAAPCPSSAKNAKTNDTYGTANPSATNSAGRDSPAASHKVTGGCPKTFDLKVTGKNGQQVAFPMLVNFCKQFDLKRALESAPSALTYDEVNAYYQHILKQGSSFVIPSSEGLNMRFETFADEACTKPATSETKIERVFFRMSCIEKKAPPSAPISAPIQEIKSSGAATIASAVPAIIAMGASLLL